MSWTSTIFEITPLLPCRPASLSPSAILRFLATNTRTRSLTPGGRSSPSSRLKVLTSMTTPPSPCGTLSEVSRTSRPFSLQFARTHYSSAHGGTNVDDRLLVDQRALVGAHELLQLVLLGSPVIAIDHDLLGVDIGHGAPGAGDAHIAGVNRRATLHAGPHQRGVGDQQRY